MKILLKGMGYTYMCVCVCVCINEYNNLQVELNNITFE